MFTKTFTDPQGTTHVDAVFKVSQATLRVNKQSQLDASVGYVDAIMTDTDTTSLDYQILYWPNMESFEANLPPYPLLNLANLNDPMMQHSQEEKVWFRIQDLDASCSGLTAEKAAEVHCESVI